MHRKKKKTEQTSNNNKEMNKIMTFQALLTGNNTNRCRTSIF